MNTVTYTSGNLLFSFPTYNHEFSYDQTKDILMKELLASASKIKEYLVFKDQLDEEERQYRMSPCYWVLPEVRKTIRNREVKITHFIETLTDNQITLLYLLFQAGSDIQGGMIEGVGDLCKLLYCYVDANFNFTYTNNRQFKLSYFHNYLFTRNDAAKNVRAALNTSF